MDKIKFYFFLFLGKFVSRVLTLFHFKATSFPGLLVLKYFPGFIKSTQKYCKNEIICVTGTNGKTTTSGFIGNILKTDKRNFVHNTDGANMLTGVATALIKRLSFFKPKDNFLFESDEAYLSKLFESLNCNYLVVTNFFRDQLDRYGELEITAAKIQEAIEQNNLTTLVLNADDPMVAKLAELNPNTKIFFGVESINFLGENNRQIEEEIGRENINCKCGMALSYNDTFYAHLGKYSCPCGWKRPNLDISAKVNIFDDYSELIVSYKNTTYNFIVNLTGTYNVYNALAAISVGLLMNISSDVIKEALISYKSIFGRTQKLKFNGRDVLIQLIKNPTGANEVLKTIDLDSNLLIIINDNYADGRDVSWLWDTNFEIIKEVKNNIIVSGTRAWDMAVRLKYAGVSSDKIIVNENIEKAFYDVINNTNENGKITILPTYTSLLRLLKIKGI